MPPKQDKTDRPYGLTDAELKTSISVLRLLAIDSNIPIDRNALAKLTGHEKPNTAYKIWTLAKAKLVAVGGDNGTADDGAPSASTAKPVKRARANTKAKAKAKASGSKKAVAPVDDDEEEEEDDSSDELNEPAPKRAKKLPKQQSANDSC